MHVREMIQDFVNKMENQLHLSVVFGEPMQVMDKTFIPVAKVAFGFGFGSGQGAGRWKKQKPENKDTEAPTSDDSMGKKPGEGGGGGGGGKVSPLGMFEVTGTGTRFIPVITAQEVAGIIVLIFVLIRIMRRSK